LSPTSKDAPVKEHRRRLKDVLKSARRQWKAHKEEEALEVEAAAAKREAEQAAASKRAVGRVAPTDELMLRVRDLMGKELSIRFRNSSKLRFLMTATQMRLGLPASELKFTYEGRQLAPEDTPASLGMVDRGLIEVGSAAMLETKRQKDKEDKERAARAERKERVQVKLQKVREERQKAREQQAWTAQQRFTETELLPLTFKDKKGRQMHMHFKKSNGMQKLLQIVCKRMALQAAGEQMDNTPSTVNLDDSSGSDEQSMEAPGGLRCSFARSSNGQPVRATDSMMSLGLADNEVILVKLESLGAGTAVQ